MWTYEDQCEEFSSMAQTDNTSHLTHGYKNINMGIKKLETFIGMPPAQEEYTFTTEANVFSYPLPSRFIKLTELYVTVSSERHYAKPVYNESTWGIYHQRPGAVTSDMLSRVFPRPELKKFEIYPTPSVGTYTGTMIYEAHSKDLTANDYTTGNITTLANLGTAVTGSSTVWTSAMAGRYMRLTDDGDWLKIQSVTDNTHLTLLQPYQGTAISAGTATYTIGEICRLPEGTHDLPVSFALWKHFLGNQHDAEQAKKYEKIWKDGAVEAKATFGSRFSSGVIQSQRMRNRQKDINNYPDLSGLE